MEPDRRHELELEVRRLSNLLREAASSLSRLGDLLQEDRRASSESRPKARRTRRRRGISAAIDDGADVSLRSTGARLSERSEADARPDARLPESDRELLAALHSEISATEPRLLRMSTARCTAQVATWAGRVRSVQAGTGPADDPSFRELLARLNAIRRDHHCAWIDALAPDWVADDWAAYVAYNAARAAGSEPKLTPSQARAYHRGALRGLQMPQRVVRPDEAIRTIEDALAVLPADDKAIAAAQAKFQWLEGG